MMMQSPHNGMEWNGMEWNGMTMIFYTIRIKYEYDYDILYNSYKI